MYFYVNSLVKPVAFCRRPGCSHGLVGTHRTVEDILSKRTSAFPLFLGALSDLGDRERLEQVGNLREGLGASRKPTAEHGGAVRVKPRTRN
jgi:hypothetical protein